MAYPLWYQGLRLLPKNFLSAFMGKLASLRCPPFIIQPVIKWFIKRFQVNMTESLHPATHFSSFQDFFTRELKADVRSHGQEKNLIISPCDGAFGECGPIHQGQLIQAKGKSYTLAQLLADAGWAKEMEGGTYQTIYLSPKDYHRFHAPVDLYIQKARYIPGSLWPVHPKAVATVKDLFCINERLVIMTASPAQPQAYFAIVAVGATVVGKIKTVFEPRIGTPLSRKKGLYFDYSHHPYFLSKAAELGRFELGSTLVLVASKGFGLLESNQPGTKVTLGQQIGRLID